MKGYFFTIHYTELRRPKLPELLNNARSASVIRIGGGWDCLLDDFCSGFVVLKNLGDIPFGIIGGVGGPNGLPVSRSLFDEGTETELPDTVDLKSLLVGEKNGKNSPPEITLLGREDVDVVDICFLKGKSC